MMKDSRQRSAALGIVAAVREIKAAILRTRYMAARLANAEMLKLYFGTGAYVSVNSRKGKWGTGAIAEISARLQQELPGLKGFSESSIKRMRRFFEVWCSAPIRQSVIGELAAAGSLPKVNRQSAIDDLAAKNFLPSIQQSNHQLPSDKFRPLAMGDLAGDAVLMVADSEFRPSTMGEMSESDFAYFCAVPFTHHTVLFEKCNQSDERWYYIRRIATEFWSVTALKTHIRAGDYRRRGKLPNNFALTIPEHELAARAARMFADEVFLEGINVGEDEGDVDEKLLEHEIVANIRKFMMSLGPDFCFMGEQFRVIVQDEEQFIDLLFYNRALKCLIALELKGGKFKPAYLGQLNFYLSALDDKVKRPDENPSIGIILCREANRGFVEMAIRDMTKPMGVAVFRSDKKVPRAYRQLEPMLKGLTEIMEDRS